MPQALSRPTVPLNRFSQGEVEEDTATVEAEIVEEDTATVEAKIVEGVEVNLIGHPTYQ